MANDDEISETPSTPNWGDHQPAGGGWTNPPPPPPPGPWGHWPSANPNPNPYQTGWGGHPGYGYPYDPHSFGTPPRRRRKGGAAALLVAGALMIGGAGLAVGVGIGSSGSQPSASSPTTNPTTNPTTGNSGGGSSSASTGSKGGSVSTSGGSPTNVSSIAKKVDPGLVDINTQLEYESEEAAGTGMVLTSSGEVLTNNHVIEGATAISVTDLGNGRTYRAKVVGYDRSDDVAVLQLEHASGLTTVKTGNSNDVRQGEGILGIGNAGGLGGTPSVAGGSVTALHRSIKASDEGTGTTETLHGLIQTNADIQPGDSGGPLVNAKGQVIGMDTAAESNGTFTFQTPSSSATEGYSIPIDTALKLAKEMEAGDSSSGIHLGQTPFLGVEVTTPSELYGSEGSSFGGGFGGFGASGVSGGSGSETPPVSSGAAIVEVFPGTSAAKAGLAAGDIIVGLDGQTVSTPAGLTQDLLAHHPGQKVSVNYVTSSDEHETTSFTLQSGPPQ